MVFQSLDKNYLSLLLNVELHLGAVGLGDAIKNKNTASNQNYAIAIIFLRHHLEKKLKIKYLTTKDPSVLWNRSKERYNHLKMVILPKVRYEWIHLKFQDYKFVHEYHCTMFKISSHLKLCGKIFNDDMMKKTLCTFIPRMCSCRNNIKRKISINILN